MHSCLFLNLYYPAFLQSAYAANPLLASASYNEQLNVLRNARFGDSDFYSYNLGQNGWKTDDLILNAVPLQSAWAKENSKTTHGLHLALDQIAHYKPDVIYFHDLSIASKDFLDTIRPHVNIIAGQIATVIPENVHFQGFDIIISSLPHYVKHFRKLGITAYYQPLAFEKRILCELTDKQYRDIDCSFIGGISPVHSKYTPLLEYLAVETDIKFWGYGVENLAKNSPILPKHNGESWGLEMFELLNRSNITINRHVVAVSANYANNMRLFEATGCGALLITDAKENQGELFESGKEIIEYSSPLECVEMIRYYEAHPTETAAIAAAGQRRTLSEHTYSERMKQTAERFERHLRYKRETEYFKGISTYNISTDHTLIKKSDITASLRHGWLDKEIPRKQRALVQQELAQMYKGNMPLPYKIAAEAFQEIAFNGINVLEIGCSSGYYSEVLEYSTGKNINYIGADISPDFIKMAENYYPKCEFIVADGASLPFANEQFDAVFSAGVLQYSTEYSSQIAETCRVAKTWVLAHRTPLCLNRQTQYIKKKAYSIEIMELLFNEKEFVNEFINHGFILKNALTIAENMQSDYVEKTFIFYRNSHDDIILSNKDKSIKEIKEEYIKTNHAAMDNQNATAPYPNDMMPEEILQKRAYGFVEKAQNAMQNNNFTEALYYLDEAMITHSQLPNVQYLRSLCLWRLGRIDEAFVALQGELKIMPHNPMALYATSMASRSIKPFIESALINTDEIKYQVDMLRNFEFKIYSKSGEDGILLGLLSRVGVVHKRFIKIGIGSGDECNTANLSLNHGWKGLLIDANSQQVDAARKFYAHLPQVRVEQSFVTIDNINELFIQMRATGELDVFSLDIDGNDYWIMERLNVIKPRIVILEYNPSFGPERSITIPYDPKFYCMDYHKSGWYHGASLTALTKLMCKKGFILVGCDSNGYNAFFVRSDVAEGVLRELPPEEAYYPAKPRFRHGTHESQFSVVSHLQFTEIQ